MLRMALRNLFQNKVRLLIAVGGVALALMLILALDAVVGGMETKLTAYIDYSGADIFVAQSGVRNMHMASSAMFFARTKSGSAHVSGPRCEYVAAGCHVFSMGI